MALTILHKVLWFVTGATNQAESSKRIAGALVSGHGRGYLELDVNNGGLQARILLTSVHVEINIDGVLFSV